MARDSKRDENVGQCLSLSIIAAHQYLRRKSKGGGKKVKEKEVVERMERRGWSGGDGVEEMERRKWRGGDGAEEMERRRWSGGDGAEEMERRRRKIVGKI